MHGPELQRAKVSLLVRLPPRVRSRMMDLIVRQPTQSGNQQSDSLLFGIARYKTRCSCMPSTVPSLYAHRAHSLAFRRRVDTWPCCRVSIRSLCWRKRHQFDIACQAVQVLTFCTYSTREIDLPRSRSSQVTVGRTTLRTKGREQGASKIRWRQQTEAVMGTRRVGELLATLAPSCSICGKR